MFTADKIGGCVVSRKDSFSKKLILVDVGFMIDLSRCYKPAKMELEY